MAAGGLVPSQTYKDLAACADNTAVIRPVTTSDRRDVQQPVVDLAAVVTLVCLTERTNGLFDLLSSL